MFIKSPVVPNFGLTPLISASFPLTNIFFPLSYISPRSLYSETKFNPVFTVFGTVPVINVELSLLNPLVSTPPNLTLTKPLLSSESVPEKKFSPFIEATPPPKTPEGVTESILAK